VNDAPTPAPYTPGAPIQGLVHAAFRIPRDELPPFFELPWPSELYRDEHEKLDWRSFPGKNELLISDYIDTVQRDTDGYSVVTSVYFHFNGPIDETRLPDGAREAPTIRDALFLVDVDPKSPDKGSLVPLVSRYHAQATRYVEAHTLAAKPLPGFVLRPGTLYAAVLRRDLGSASHEPLGTAAELEWIKWTKRRSDPAEEHARALHYEAFNRIETLGVPRAEIASIALFRTQTPHTVTERMFETATRLSGQKAPRVVSAEWHDEYALPYGPGGFYTIRGAYCTPNFQTNIDNAPFIVDEGGAIALDERGVPQVIDLDVNSAYRRPECGGLLRARFVLTVPISPMPKDGYPLIVASHGTGGDAYSFIGTNDIAGWAAREGIAVVSTDQPLHGARDELGGRPGSRANVEISIAGFPLKLEFGDQAGELSFYNFIRPAAARDNLRQAAVDGAVLARLITSVDLGRGLLPHREGRPMPRFDRSRILLAGHSQGSQSAIVQGALDPLVRGVILSGCGGDARLGILLRDDLAIMPVLRAMLALAPGELDALHPFMSLVQTLADPIDPQSYARLYWDPLPGRRAQNVLHLEGLWDSYTPPPTAEALAVALHATPLEKTASPILGLGRPEGSLEDLFARARATRAFAQFSPTRGEDGHFVLYNEPDASVLARRFMKGVVRAFGPR